MTKSGTVATPGRESPTEEFEGIRIQSETGDMDMGGGGGIEAANCVAGIGSVTNATPPIATPVQALERNANR